MLSPTVDTIAQEQAGRIKVGKVNIDEQPELAERFRVMSHSHPDGLQGRAAGGFHRGRTAQARHPADAGMMGSLSNIGVKKRRDFLRGVPPLFQVVGKDHGLFGIGQLVAG